MNPGVLDVLPFALSITLKASLLLGIAGAILTVAHRRTSAAMRHFVWTLAIASVLLLPVASLTLPAWAVMTRTASARASLPGPRLPCSQISHATEANTASMAG
jgi:hypothetical protein